MRLALEFHKSHFPHIDAILIGTGLHRGVTSSLLRVVRSRVGPHSLTRTRGPCRSHKGRYTALCSTFNMFPTLSYASLAQLPTTQTQHSFPTSLIVLADIPAQRAWPSGRRHHEYRNRTPLDHLPTIRSARANR